MKLDLFKQHKDEYRATKKPSLVETKPTSYLMIEGTGAPGEQVFEDRVGALYAMAYTLKFQSKFAGQDYTVCKLEGLYGVNGQRPSDIPNLPKSEWNWQLLIRVPDFIDDTKLAEARAALREKGKEGDFDAVTLVTFDEGTCAQILHVGPYEEERPAIEAMHALAAENGMSPHLWHHEIYLSDPRRVEPARLRTILRSPLTSV